MPTRSSHPVTPIGLRLLVRSANRVRRAFSLIEILVVVTLLSVIIIGLVAMFSSTQKALLSSTTQVDLLETGRATMDMIGRELEQMTPSYTNARNFSLTNSPYPLGYQTLTDPNEQRTNVIQEVFFVARSNLQWNAIGYRVASTNLNVAMGTLYRYSASTNTIAGLERLHQDFNTTPLTNLSRIADGVVHLRLKAYDTNGVMIRGGWGTNVYVNFNLTSGDYTYDLYNNAVPAFLELELGILETRPLKRFAAISDPKVAGKFIRDHAAQVHLFRQRIPIRNVDPSAYNR